MIISSVLVLFFFFYLARLTHLKVLDQVARLLPQWPPVYLFSASFQQE